jgi:hypothetical protein
MATDWPAIKVEYLNSNASLRELAAKHGINEAGVLARGAREGWDEERKRIQTKVIAKANKSLEQSRTEQLIKLNRDDLEAANAIKAKVREMLHLIDTPNDLRALSASLDTAQKISRLALGVETAKTTSEVSGKMAVTSLDLKSLSDEELAQMEALLDKTSRE